MRAHTITNLTRPAWRRLVLLVLGVCALAIPATAGAAQQSTSAEAVRDWNLYAANALGNPPTAPVMPGIGQAPQVSVLHVAMVQGAVYDAVNAIDGGHQPYLAAPPAAPSDSKAAAAATAAYGCWSGSSRLGGADAAAGGSRLARPGLYADSLAAVPDGASKTGRHRGRRGRRRGDARRARRRRPLRPVRVRRGHRSRRVAAGAAAGTSGIVAGPGCLGRQRAPVPRPERGDAPHRRPERAHERRLRGGLQRGQGARLADEHERAPPTRRQPRSSGRTAARDLEPRLPRRWRTSQELDIVDSARLFAMTNLAAADGSIGCWNDKAYWSFWRPITAIREAASDGNPATEADPAWVPLFDPTVPVSGPPLVTPGFPDHPSGHTCISGAIVHALQGVLRHRQGRVHGDQQQVLSRTLSAEELRPLLGRAQGDHRRPRVERDPLPHRRRAGSRARQEGRALPGEALLPAGRTDQRHRMGARRYPCARPGQPSTECRSSKPSCRRALTWTSSSRCAARRRRRRPRRRTPGSRGSGRGSRPCPWLGPRPCGDRRSGP